MRIGVISDTHGFTSTVARAIKALLDVDAWLHLGDVVSDAEYIESRVNVPVYRVAGNCDAFSLIESERVITLENKRILMTHGHAYRPAYDRTKLFYRAEELACDVVLYGHTHVSLVEASGAVIAMNPGSPSQPREGRAPSIGLLTIENGDVDTRIIVI